MSNSVFRKSWGAADGAGCLGEDSLVNWQSLANCSSSVARNLVDFNVALKMKALPLGVLETGRGSLLTVATSSADKDLLAQIKFASGCSVRAITVDSQVLERAIFSAYNGDQFSLRDQINKISDIYKRKQERSSSEDIAIKNEFDSGSPAALVERLLTFAVANSASDLHLVPSAEGFFVNLRIDGVLFKATDLIHGKKLKEEVIARIKILSNLDITKHHIAQDGSFAYSCSGFDLHLRVAIMPTVFGEKAVLRFLGNQELLTIKSLGLSRECRNFLDEFLSGSSGGCLFAGPTGSGKSTTMYASLVKLTSGNHNIVTVEDPVELYIPGISQTSILPQEGLGFAQALRAILRHDPDVIVLGEMRDSESAVIALQAAITGHLVLSSIHAKDALEVFLRLLHFEVDICTVAQAVKLIMAQRLVPRLCNFCRKRSKIGGVNRGYHGMGCQRCAMTGHNGRVLITEALKIDLHLREHLMQGDFSLTGIRELLNHENYCSFFDSAERHLHSGDISYEEFERIIRD